MSKILDDVARLIQGRDNCNSCGGTGWTTFKGTKIVCMSCNDRDAMVAYWNSVDAFIAKRTIAKNSKK